MSDREAANLDCRLNSMDRIGCWRLAMTAELEL
jgi:hypothetical protein